jgi:hypothetical protein
VSETNGTAAARRDRRPDRAVGFAVVGAGLVGPRHAEFATKAEGAALRVVCDLREDRGRALADKLGAEWAPDYREVVRREDVQVVNVCLPTALHLEVATAAAEAGKHVVVEKPIELDVRRARQLIDVCRRSGVKLAAILRAATPSSPARTLSIPSPSSRPSTSPPAATAPRSRSRRFWRRSGEWHLLADAMPHQSS